MPEYIKKYKFKKPPKTITYYDDKPLELTNDFTFYHNKSKFRKELNRFQQLFKNYLSTSLIASAIRDSYLKEDYTNEYLILLFTKKEIVRETNQIIEAHIDEEIQPGSFFLEATSKYILLLAVDMEGLILGLNTLEEIFIQTFEDYFDRKQFDEYIKIRPFKIVNCKL